MKFDLLINALKIALQIRKPENIKKLDSSKIVVSLILPPKKQIARMTQPKLGNITSKPSQNPLTLYSEGLLLGKCQGKKSPNKYE
jgi:hypothetical protein